MLGDAITGPVFVPLPLAGPFAANNDRPTYGPARLDTATGLRVQPSDWFGSADLRGLLAADALVSLPAGAVEMKVGESILTYLL
jgi:molybdopterin biosynthesis enzyme